MSALVLDPSTGLYYSYEQQCYVDPATGYTVVYAEDGKWYTYDPFEGAYVPFAYTPPAAAAAAPAATAADAPDPPAPPVASSASNAIDALAAQAVAAPPGPLGAADGGPVTAAALDTSASSVRLPWADLAADLPDLGPDPMVDENDEMEDTGHTQQPPYDWSHSVDPFAPPSATVNPFAPPSATVDPFAPPSETVDPFASAAASTNEAASVPQIAALPAAAEVPPFAASAEHHEPSASADNQVNTWPTSALPGTSSSYEPWTAPSEPVAETASSSYEPWPPAAPLPTEAPASSDEPWTSPAASLPTEAVSSYEPWAPTEAAPSSYEPWTAPAADPVPAPAAVASSSYEPWTSPAASLPTEAVSSYEPWAPTEAAPSSYEPWTAPAADPVPAPAAVASSTYEPWTAPAAPLPTDADTSYQPWTAPAEAALPPNDDPFDALYQQSGPRPTAAAAASWGADELETLDAETFGDQALFGSSAPPTIDVQQEDGTEDATGGWPKAVAITPEVAPFQAAAATINAVAAHDTTMGPLTPQGSPLPATVDGDPSSQYGDMDDLDQLAVHLQSATLASAVRPAHTHPPTHAMDTPTRAPALPAASVAAASPATTAPTPATATSAANVCPTCQRVNVPDANFCSKCGTRLHAVVTEEAPLAWGAVDAIDDGVVSDAATNPYAAASDASGGAATAAAEDPYAIYGGYEAYVQYYYASVFAAGRDQWLAAGFTDESYDAYAAHVTASAVAAQVSQATQPTQDAQQPEQAYEAPATVVSPVFHDPLGRRPRAIASFGFGGTLVLVFPERQAQFDAATGAVQERDVPGLVSLRRAKDMEPGNALVQSLRAWPGPLHKGTENALRARIAALISESSSLYSANDHACLWKLLTLMLEHGATKWMQPAVQERVRQLLLEDRAQQGAFVNEPTGAMLGAVRGRSEAERTAALTEIEQLLLNGERQDAVQRAVAAGLWAHALVLASSLPRPVWQSVTSQWLASAASPGEPLHTLVQLLHGADKVAPGLNVESTDLLGRWRENACVILANRPAGDALALSRLADALLRSGRPSAAHVCQCGRASLSALLATWAADASLLPPPAQPLVGAPLTAQARSALDIASIHRTEVAAYLRAVAHPPAGPTTLAGVLAALQGASPAPSPAAGPKPEPLPTVQAAAVAFAWFQPNRLAYAAVLADWGFTGEALAYCEDIMGVVKQWPKGVPATYYTTAFVNAVVELDARLRNHGAVATGSAAARGSAGPGASNSGGGAGTWLKFDGWKDLLDRGLDLVIGDHKADPAATAAAANAAAAATAPPSLQPGRMAGVPMFPGASTSALGPAPSARQPTLRTASTDSSGPATGGAVPFPAATPAPAPAFTTTPAPAAVPAAAGAGAATTAPVMPTAPAVPHTAAPPAVSAAKAPAPPSDDKEDDDTKPNDTGAKGDGAGAAATGGLFSRLTGMMGFGFAKPKNTVKLGESKMSLRYDPVEKRWINDDDPNAGKPAAPPPPPPSSASFQRRESAPPPATPAAAAPPPPGPLGADGNGPVAGPSTSSSFLALNSAGPTPTASPTAASRPAAGTRRGGARSRYVDVMNPNGATAAAPVVAPIPNLMAVPLQPMLVSVDSADAGGGAAAGAGADSYTSFYGAGGNFDNELQSHQLALQSQKDTGAPGSAAS